uniref:AlNc14C36G3227 protein n=1 Tax=Albugo laibachii Nc14 TaxID=890382 RepID=F0W8V3_9STRA|nr:AlNc14C36G3227 [Albugo laibachii Nc14]CCA27844.1 AlNc14C735G12462 [Albugo laibachii Nc14]|eukprot:CCA27844.1 AlNc14C735G12462 [Albugo laibachii Nc14]
MSFQQLLSLTYYPCRDYVTRSGVLSTLRSRYNRPDYICMSEELFDGIKILGFCHHEMLGIILHKKSILHIQLNHPGEDVKNVRSDYLNIFKFCKQ